MDRATDRASVLSHNLVLLGDRSDKKKTAMRDGLKKSKEQMA